MPQTNLAEIDRLVAGHHHDPHSILGAHPGPAGIVIRTLRPLAATVTVVLADGSTVPMRHVHEGVFEVTLPPGTGPAGPGADRAEPAGPGTDRAEPAGPGTDRAEPAGPGTDRAEPAGPGTDRAEPAGPGTDGTEPAEITPAEIPDYRLAVAYPGGSDSAVRTDSTGGAAGPPPPLTDDPYRHLPTLGEMDLHLISEGRHEQLWKVLGAHVRTAATRDPAPGSALAGTSGTARQPAQDLARGGTSDSARQPLRIINHAHPGFEPVTGTSFAVWAPNARGVRVLGDFNHWDGRGHPMRSLGGTGVWELFVPGVGNGAMYKYQICAPDGTWRVKADPMAQAAQCPPATASAVYTSEYEWGDGDWLATRGAAQAHREPMSVYEVHLGSWRPGQSYRELAGELTEYVRGMGFTHVEFLPVAEYPFGGSWGYQVSSYYAPTARFGTPDEFRHLVDRLHQAGIGVLLDWVPAHFPRDDWALARFDGTPLYEHADPRRGEHPDWGTLVFDYGRAEVRNFLVANALYWLEEFHIDGLRVDAVASMLYLDYSRADGQWTPNVHGGRENLDAISFLQEVNTSCYRRSPGIAMIAEESTAWPGVTRPVHLGGLGFGFKWNMGWMHDTLGYLAHDPVFRHYHHNELTFSLLYAFSENYVLPLSHDEVVHGKGSLLGKMPGDDWRRFAGLRALFGYMWAHPGKKLLFMGSEFGQGGEWSEQRGLDWWVLDDDLHRGVQHLVRDLNRVYAQTPALWRQDVAPEGFAWIDANDAGGNTLSFLRFAGPTGPPGPPGSAGSAGPAGPAGPAGQLGAQVVACVVNFAAVPHDSYRIGLPHPGGWREVLNTDAIAYGGSGVGNLGAVEAVPQPWHGEPASATLTVPPLGVLWLTPQT